MNAVIDEINDLSNYNETRMYRIILEYVVWSKKKSLYDWVMVGIVWAISALTLITQYPKKM